MRYDLSCYGYIIAKGYNLVEWVITFCYGFRLEANLARGLFAVDNVNGDSCDYEADAGGSAEDEGYGFIIAKAGGVWDGGSIIGGTVGVDGRAVIEDGEFVMV